MCVCVCLWSAVVVVAVAVVDGCGGGEASGVCLSRFSSALGWGWSSASRAAGEPGQSSLTSAKEKAQSCSLCLLEEILCILRSYPTSAESDQLGLLCCQPEPFADASTPLNGSFSVSTHWGLSAMSGALICMHEITWQVRLQFRTKEVTGYIPYALNVAHNKKLSAPHRMREQRGRARGAQRAAQRRGCASPGCTNTLGRSPRKNYKNDLDDQT